MKETIKIQLLSSNAILPTRGHKTDAGLDLYAAEDAFIQVGELKKISTGIAIEIPEGQVGLICDRSSMGAKGLKVFGGVVDHGYSGEVFVTLFNATHKDHLNMYSRDNKNLFGYKLEKGTKIAQILVYHVSTPKPVQVEAVFNGDRSSRGFGSTGV